MAMQAERLSVILDIVAKLSMVDDEDSPRAAYFVVDGHPLVAVAYTEPGRDFHNGNGAAEEAMVVGRLHCAGTQYLIFDADDPAEDDHIPPPTAADILTRRELQIASLIGDGNSDKEIALQLGISGYTVREHIRRIFAKLNIGRRAAIVSYILRQPPSSLS